MTGILGLPKILIELPRHRDTLPVDKVPRVFEEPYILTGYRPTYRPWSYYLLSFFQLHNESFNVWTHTLTIIVILLQLTRLFTDIDFWTHKDTSAIIGFATGALITAFVSSVTHLLHSKSPWWHYTLFLMDYGGVTFYSLGTSIAMIYIYAQKNVYAMTESFYLPLNVFLSWVGFLCCCIAKLLARDNKTRRLLMVSALAVQCLLGCLPVVARYVSCILDESCSLSSLKHIHCIVVLLLVNAFTFSMHVPEGLKPGYFDIVGQGHQIFHVASMLLMLFKLEAVKTDILSGFTAHTQPQFRAILTAYAVLFVLELITIIGMRGLIAKKVKAMEKRK